MRKDNKKNKAFTLIELIVAATIFTVIMLTITSSFVSVIRAQRKSLVEQELLNQSSYAIEYMSRALRMASKELNCTDPLDQSTCDFANPPYCLTTKGYGYNYETHDGNTKLRFINGLQENDCQEFFLHERVVGEETLKQIAYQKDVDGGTENLLYLTSPNFQVNSFSIRLIGEAQPPADNLQPRVTISFEIQKEEYPPLRVQTTISQRNLDVRY